VVDSLAVASVSTGDVAPSVAVEEAIAVSAPDFSERAQAAANRAAARIPARAGRFIDPE